MVIENARVQYGSANRAERNAEIDRHVARQERITLRDLNDRKLILLGADDLAARMAALDTLAKHCQLLLVLASSDAPLKAQDAASSLDDAIANLTTSLGHVPSDGFKDTASGFSTIAAQAARLAMDHKITEALDKAISTSENDVVSLIRVLRQDMAALYERQRSNLSTARVAATDEYNSELEKPNPNPEMLRKSATRIKETENAWDSLPLQCGAGPGLDAMAEAHAKLVEYAKSPKTPQDLVQMVEAMDSFVTRAKTIGDAIKTIRKGRNEQP